MIDTWTWIAQGVLAFAFLGSGVFKGTQSKARMLATGQTGVAPYPVAFIRFIALCEVAGAIGVVVPTATGIAPQLAMWAALGLAAIMVGAAITHARLQEPRAVAVNVLLLSLCLLVAFQRGT